jgi:hypothetical protein
VFHEPVNLIIKDPHIDSDLKFIAAIEVLSKAMKQHFDVKLSPTAEKSPYKAIREMEDQMRKTVDQLLYDLYAEICEKWLRIKPLYKARETEPFKLNGRIFINPTTQMPLTNKQWSEIQKDLERGLHYVFGRSKETMVKHAVLLGKVLQSIDSSVAKTLTYDAVKGQLTKTPPYLQDIMDFAEQQSAEYIVDLTGRARKNIATTIIEAQRSGKSTRQLESELFDTFGDMNRDWRRIAETEIASNVTNGQLITELRAEPEETIFMQGISAGGACPFCRDQIDGAIVVLLPSAPSSGDKITIDGKQYTAIWPGKSQVGRARKDWWICIPAHPHCKCGWDRTFVELEEYSKKIAETIKER